MTGKTLKIVTPLFICFLLLSCGKDNDDGGSGPKSKTTLLTQQDWGLSKVETKINSDPWVDEFSTWSACNKDNRWVLRTNNTYEVNEGPAKCDPANPQIVQTGSWALTDGETKVTIGPYSYTIDQLNETTLVITYSITSGATTFYTKNTLVH